MQPDTPESQLAAWIEKVQGSHEPQIDKAIMVTAIKLVYHCGLKTGEIISLNIGDVLDAQGHIVDQIVAGNRIKNGQRLEIYLLPISEEILRDHLNYLKKNNYNVARDAPLFPQKNKSRYVARKLTRHLAKFNLPVTFGEIRRAGFSRFFERLNRPSWTDRRTQYTDLASFARISKKYLKRLIKESNAGGDD